MEEPLPATGLPKDHAALGIFRQAGQCAGSAVCAAAHWVTSFFCSSSNLADGWRNA